MNRGDLSDLNTFLTIAEHLSFRAAAAQLGVTSSALSHSIRQLEGRLGARLLHRTTRSVSLTDSGNRLLERLRPGMAQISGALEELKGERDRPSGRLRDLCPTMGRTHSDRADVATLPFMLPRRASRSPRWVGAFDRYRCERFGRWPCGSRARAC